MFQVGDIIMSGPPLPVAQSFLIREITEVRETGYTWKYPDIPDQDWWSENSADPMFSYGWTKIGRRNASDP